jgi:hypothetical protein
MRILVDVFPAHVAVAPAGLLTDISTLKSDPPTEGATYLQTARVVMTETDVYIAIDSNQGPVIAFMEPYLRENYYQPASKTDDYRVMTSTGKMVAFKKDENCGCGSRLRGWNPYKTVTSIKG